MNYRINNKVFRTEDEARAFSKDLQAYGALGGWTPTEEEPTHIYKGDLYTEPIEDGAAR